jgi:hypothetical protein
VRGDGARCRRVGTHAKTQGTNVPVEEMIARKRGTTNIYIHTHTHLVIGRMSLLSDDDPRIAQDEERTNIG